jgi:hypothetical protein
MYCGRRSSWSSHRAPPSSLASRPPPVCASPAADCCYPPRMHASAGCALVRVRHKVPQSLFVTNTPSRGADGRISWASGLHPHRALATHARTHALAHTPPVRTWSHPPSLRGERPLSGGGEGVAWGTHGAPAAPLVFPLLLLRSPILPLAPLSRAPILGMRAFSGGGAGVHLRPLWSGE